jgi:(2R)-sulfolactate sulfo-lyase subunit alpha
MSPWAWAAAARAHNRATPAAAVAGPFSGLTPSGQPLQEITKMIHFVLHDKQDSVAVVVVEGVKAGMALEGWIMDEDQMTSVTAKQDIPIGHKIALRSMAVGETVIKYGIDMGKVVKPIAAGEHAHVHNIKTKRW